MLDLMSLNLATSLDPVILCFVAKSCIEVRSGTIIKHLLSESTLIAVAFPRLLSNVPIEQPRQGIRENCFEFGVINVKSLGCSIQCSIFAVILDGYFLKHLPYKIEPLSVLDAIQSLLNLACGSILIIGCLGMEDKTNPSISIICCEGELGQILLTNSLYHLGIGPPL